MMLGTVMSANDSGVTIKIDGETSASTKRYVFLSSYFPLQDDRVLIEEVGGEYVVLGKIVANRLQSYARFVNDNQVENNRNIYLATIGSNFWIGYASKSGGAITWKQITTS